MPESYAEVEAVLQHGLAGQAAASLSQAYYLDVTHENAHKGAAVIALSEILLIPPEEIATIGDGENDVRMFEVSGFSIAMGNATPAVQARRRSSPAETPRKAGPTRSSASCCRWPPNTCRRARFHEARARHPPKACDGSDGG